MTSLRADAEIGVSRSPALRRFGARQGRRLVAPAALDHQVPAVIQKAVLRIASTAAAAFLLAVADSLAFPVPEDLGTAAYGEIISESGEPIGSVRPVYQKNIAPIELPRKVRDAFVATEDRRFDHRHRAIDARACARALLANLRALALRQGCSSIPMQLARSLLLPAWLKGKAPARKIARKLWEVRMASKLTERLSKEELLRLYLNHVHLGPGVYGVAAASDDLFGKRADRLTWAEAALLAALARGPSYYDPHLHPHRALQRRNLVLQLLVKEHYLTNATALAASPKPLGVRRISGVRSNRGWAQSLIRAEIDSICREVHCGTAPLRVYSTIDSRAQQAAERTIGKYTAMIQRRIKAPRRARAERNRVEGALITIDAQTGAVRAIVGGSRYRQGGDWNRALHARRPAGSTFKMLSFACAIAHGAKSNSLIDDSPVVVQYDNSVWTPRNHNNNYAGLISLRRAFAESRNSAAVRIGVPEIPCIRKLGAALGISTTLPTTPAIVLGAALVTPAELAKVAGALATTGRAVPPAFSVLRLETIHGRVLWEHQAVLGRQVIDPGVASQVGELMRAVIDSGTAKSLRALAIKETIKGKTGTTTAGRDLWFVAVTGYNATAVWFGGDRRQISLGPEASAARYAVPAFAEYSTLAKSEMPTAR